MVGRAILREPEESVEQGIFDNEINVELAFLLNSILESVCSRVQLIYIFMTSV